MSSSGDRLAQRDNLLFPFEQFHSLLSSTHVFSLGDSVDGFSDEVKELESKVVDSVVGFVSTVESVVIADIASVDSVVTTAVGLLDSVATMVVSFLDFYIYCLFIFLSILSRPLKLKGNISYKY